MRLAEGAWPEPETKRPLTPDAPIEAVQVDPLLSDPVPTPVAIKKRLSPSSLGGDKVLGGGGLDEASAKRRGTQVHSLLEHLPDCADPQTLATNLLLKGVNRAEPDEIPALLAEAQASIAAHPDLFAQSTLAEVDIAAMAPSLSSEIYGTIDRLVIKPDHILIVDFKTNAVVPACAEDTPEGLLRQMGAYLEAAEQIWMGSPHKGSNLMDGQCGSYGFVTRYCEDGVAKSHNILTIAW